MCFTNGCHKDQWQNQTELARFKIVGKLAQITTFPVLIYLCVSIPTPESWRTLPLIYLCVCFKATWCLADMLCSCILRDLCSERQTAVNHPKPTLTHTGRAYARESLKWPKVIFASIPCYNLCPKRVLCSPEHNVCLYKGTWKPMHAQLPPATPGNFHAFPKALMTCLPSTP